MRLTEALAFWKQMRSPGGTAQALAGIGRLAIAESKLDDARQALSQSLRLRREIGDLVGVVDCLEAIASLVAASGAVEEAVLLQDAAEAQRHRIGVPLSPMARELRDAWLTCRPRCEAERRDLIRAWPQPIERRPGRRLLGTTGEEPRPGKPAVLVVEKAAYNDEVLERRRIREQFRVHRGINPTPESAPV